MGSGTFYMPAKVHVEQEAVAHHAHELVAYGRRALIVTGRGSVVACGVYEDVCQALDAEGIAHAWFPDVEENPSTDTVMRGRDAALAAKADFVIGAGGGSPMDAAKSIALMAAHPEADKSYLYDSHADSRHLPIVCIPTTCGTGSEVTAVSVLSVPELGVKKSIPHKIFANLALVDGKYLRSAPRSVLANTGFDALAHLYESYASNSSTTLSRIIADDGIRVWKENRSVLCGQREPDAHDFERLMLAATLGGMAIAHTGTSLPHALSYPLTYDLHIPHGKAVCYFLAGYIAETPAPMCQHLLETAGFSSTTELAQAYEAACGPLNVDADALQRVLDNAYTTVFSNPARTSKAPFKVDETVMHRIVYGS